MSKEVGTLFAGRHAVVIGGSIAGLVVGRVLADHFAQVTIVERDALADTAESRKGVPQGRHAHGLLNKGRNILSDLFPNLMNDMMAAGTVKQDMGADLHWYHLGQWKAQFQSGIDAYSHTRPLLELEIRHQLASWPNIRFMTQTDVTGLIMNPAGTQVVGIHVEHRDAHTTEDLQADLVVEAGGRGSRMPGWLEALGFGRVPESVVKMDVCYTTRIYRRPANPPAGWDTLLIYPTPPEQTRMGIISPIEGDRWIVSLCGWHKDDPPTDDAGFLEYARGLPMPDLYQAIKDAEPLTSAVSHHLPSNLRRHYERLPRFPEGLAIMGDAVCSFNPIYGQGMTTAVLEADALDAALRRQAQGHPAGDLTGFAGQFRKVVAQTIAIPWMMATTEDFRFPQTTGPRPPGMGIMHWYTNQLHGVTAYDTRVLLQFFQVMHMLKSPVALFTPPIIVKVLAHRLGWRPAAVRPPAPARSTMSATAHASEPAS